MASRRKSPMVLLVIVLVLLAGAAALLLRAQPLTLDRIIARQDYTIAAQEEVYITLALSREQIPQGFPEESSASDASGEPELLLYQDGDTGLYLTAFAQSGGNSGILNAVIEPRHALSREGGRLLLPYRVNDDGTVTVGLSVDGETVQADGEPRPEAVSLVSQTSTGRFDLYVDRALFLRSDEITFQIGPFYKLTYEPA